MAPTITSADTPKEHLRLAHKIRKPLVEKMRRDRINNSIEELKALLGPQLLNQQPDSKMEKADILEMTVCLLRRQLQSKKTFVSNEAFNWGFNRCGEEVAHFLSKDSGSPLMKERLLLHIQALQSPSDGQMRDDDKCHLGSSLQVASIVDKKTTKTSLWRPW